MNIDTPETDAAQIQVADETDEVYMRVVESDFARSLERRLAVATEALNQVFRQQIGRAGIYDALNRIEELKAEK